MGVLTCLPNPSTAAHRSTSRSKPTCRFRTAPSWAESTSCRMEAASRLRDDRGRSVFSECLASGYSGACWRTRATGHDRYASVRWSPDGKRIAGVIANPLLGDAIAVASADGQDERILVPLQDGLHLHQVAWGHDGRHIYYTRTLEVNHALGDIYRVSVDGGEPEAVITTAGTAMYPAPTPDGRALVYAASHSGEGLNIWWRPLDGSPEWRVTNGAGEYTEPYIARAGRHLVCLARRRKGGLIRVPIDPAAGVEVVGVAGSGDSEPSVSAAGNRIFISSAQRSSSDLVDGSHRAASRAADFWLGRRSAASRVSRRTTARLHLQSRRSPRGLAGRGRRRYTATARECQCRRFGELVSRQPSIGVRGARGRRDETLDHRDRGRPTRCHLTSDRANARVVASWRRDRLGPSDRRRRLPPFHICIGRGGS
jgi:WD40-like Beta Propeller Repeat